MIHDINLSPLIKQRLSEAVAAQIALLEYGASTNKPSKTSCAQFLHDQGFDSVKPARSIKIAQWIWRSVFRYKPLIGFAAGEAAKKEELVEKLKREVKMLSIEIPTGTIDIIGGPRTEDNFDTKSNPDTETDTKGILDTDNNSEPVDDLDIVDDLEKMSKKQKKSWLTYGADFLRQFYDELSRRKLPECLFTNAGDFNRQDFLRAFLDKNRTLYVCPICDEAGSYTISSKNQIHTEIEHYFPKSLYPHLSCHPYNLMPICHLCNSPIHRDKDPLQPNGSTSRLQLQQIVLPYRSLALGTVTRLDIDLNNISTTFKSLVSIEVENTYETHIDSLSWVYDIPGRWNEHFGVDKVGETLFRRMKQFLRGTHELPIGNSPESVWPVLQYALYQLVYSFHTKGEESYKGGDFGKDPFAFAMKWLMVTILNEEERLSGRSEGDQLEDKSLHFHLPLFSELMQWLGQEINDKDEYISCAKELIEMLNSENASLNHGLAHPERSV